MVYTMFQVFFVKWCPLLYEGKYETKFYKRRLINTLLKNIYIVYAYEVRMKWFPLAQYFDKHTIEKYRYFSRENFQLLQP